MITIVKLFAYMRQVSLLQPSQIFHHLRYFRRTNQHPFVCILSSSGHQHICHSPLFISIALDNITSSHFFTKPIKSGSRLNFNPLQNFIDGYCFPVRFLHEMWAENSSTLQRTTYASESFRAKFNSWFYTNYPNIYLFFDLLKNMQWET